MKTRVILKEDGKYKVQWKTGWLWHDYNDGGLLSWGLDEYDNTYIYSSEEAATQDMIDLVQRYEIHLQKKKASGVVKEFSSEELRNKFAEYFV